MASKFDELLPTIIDSRGSGFGIREINEKFSTRHLGRQELG